VVRGQGSRASCSTRSARSRTSPARSWSSSSSITSSGSPKYSEEECRTKDLTFSKPLYVNVELLIKETGEIQRQRVYMGDYPWMTDQGPSSSTARSGSSSASSSDRRALLQRARGPGVGPHALQRQGHPEPRRVARVRDEQQGPALGQGGPQAQDRGDDPPPCGRLRGERPRSRRCSRRRRRPGPPVRRLDARQGPDADPRPRPSSRSTRSCARATRPPATTPPAGREPVLQLPAATTSVASAATSSTRSSTRSRRGSGRAAARRPDDHREDIAAIVGHLIECNRGLHPKDDIDHLGNRASAPTAS
jgi:DNA-directed RNA polymerase beta subunit